MSTSAESKQTALIAVLVALSGGGNAALTSTTGADLREIKKQVTQVAADTQLLNWRVYRLEEAHDGSRQRQQGTHQARLPHDDGRPGS